MSRLLLPAALVVVVLAGCRRGPEDSGTPVDDTDLPSDTGFVVDDTGEPVDPPDDTGELPDDTGEPPPPMPRGNRLGTVSGGGVVESPGYRLRLSVGDPVAVQEIGSANYRMRLGVGAPHDR